MIKQSVLSAALVAAFATPFSASAADDKELDAIRAQIREMKQSYDTRLQALEQRLQDAQAATAAAQNAALAAARAAPAPAPAAAPAPAPIRAPGASGANAFNPSVALVLGGTYVNLSQDPELYRIGGVVPPAGEIGPGRRSFNLGESELTMTANIDPLFSGQLTFALSADNEAEVEEAFVRTRGLSNGLNFKAGRFLSGLGYLNSRHAHTWDFVDAPLAYQAFLGGQYKSDGVQATWLAPTDTFVELGAEAGNGAAFPGSERNKNGVGAAALFAHAGDDIGDSASWRAGLSYLRTSAAERAFEDDGITNAFTGSSRIWAADAIYKWAPNGNPTQRNFKLQGEYFHRKESGALAQGADSAGFASSQSGWYLQGVVQFMPNWRTGLRYDRVAAGRTAIGLVDNGTLAGSAFPALAPWSPTRATVMLDYSPSEFSRLRLQFARDRARPGASDNQIFLQYIMSLGAHAAHAF
ncbi:MAG: hypothetical protein Q8R69_01395 [Telluria sp.]|nr:hypothetical protein [Telluria sp.]